MRAGKLHKATEMEWQPIETAPVEEEVLIFAPNGRGPHVFTAQFDRDLCEWSCSVEGRYAPNDDYFGDAPKKPTHWMRLPSPPNCPDLDNSTV